MKITPKTCGWIKPLQWKTGSVTGACQRYRLPTANYAKVLVHALDLVATAEHWYLLNMKCL